MKTENAIQMKTYQFALKIIKLSQFFQKDKKEFVLSKQVLLCGTSFGANVEEAIGGQSKKDFASKINMAYKEARETHNWIRLLRDSELIFSDLKTELRSEPDETLRISGSILKTVYERQPNS